MKNRMLIDNINIRSNNLSLIRFISAIFVIVCHAYPLSQGKNFVDPLLEISNGTISFGSMAVAVFFISSGLLITKSIEKYNKAHIYFRARIIRIIPPLAFTTIISVIILGVFFSKLNIYDFFVSTATYKYLLNMILIPIHSLPGVFTSNVYGGVVNGALWTLPVEFMCYILLFFTYKLGLIKNKYFKYTVFPIIIIFVMMNLVKNQFIMVLISYTQPVFMFYMGVLFYVYSDRISLNLKYFLLSVIGFIITVVIGYAWSGLLFFFPYIIIYLSFGINQIHDFANNLGLISYGIYLCAFPIQQIVVAMQGGSMNPITNLIISTPIAIIVGIIIYYFSEYKLKQVFKLR